MNWNRTFYIVVKQCGFLLQLLGIVIFVPAMVSLLYCEWEATLGFIISSCITAITGWLIYRVCHHAPDPMYNQSLIVASAGWLSVTLMGSLPFLIISWITPENVLDKLIPEGADYVCSSLVYFKNPLHRFFESMSAYTTTGLTMAIHEPSIGKGVLFYRSLAQWVGGAGFIVMALAVFKEISGKSAILLYGSEATGERLRPKIIETARVIWKVYVLVTIFSAIYLIIGTAFIKPGYSWKEIVFDSINHAMAGQSTGGFSTLDNSIAEYNSVSMDMLYLLPMILGSFSMIFYYKLFFKRQYKLIWRDIQSRSLILAFIFGSIGMSLLLFYGEDVPAPFREGIFQFISAITTTGWQTSDIQTWGWLPVVYIVSTAMVIGGASGATVGGIKIIRARIINKGLTWQVAKTFLSANTIKAIRFNGKLMLPNELNEEFAKAVSLAIFFVALVLGSSLVTFAYCSGEYTYAQSLFESASAQGTVGLSTGITHPDMPPILEVIYIFQMLTGRLEIIPVLALLRSLVNWRGN